MYTDEQMYKAIINDTIFEAAEEFYDQIKDDRITKNADGDIDIEDETLNNIVDIAYNRALDNKFKEIIEDTISIFMGIFNIPYYYSTKNQSSFERVRQKMSSSILDLIMEHHGIGGEWKKWN
jgi:hypothetical protein